MFSKFYNLFTSSKDKVTKKVSADAKDFNNISNAELAALANAVYIEGDKPNLPPGWELYHDSGYSLDTFRGACYVKYSANPVKPIGIVVATRGTIPKVESFVTDVELMTNIKLMQLDDAERFYNSLMDKIKIDHDLHEVMNKTPDFPFIFTGHSLGAILSDFLFTFSKRQNAYSNTYENPGSFDVLHNYWTAKFKDKRKAEEYLASMVEHADCYQADVNIINTANKQWGRIWKMMYAVYDYKPLKPIIETAFSEPPTYIPSALFDNLYYIGSYSFSDQHSMNKMQAYIEAGKDFYQYFTQGSYESDYPVGLNVGYNRYLSSTDYWFGYYQWCWDNYPELRTQYKENVDFFQVIDDSRDEAFRNTYPNDLSKTNHSTLFNKPQNKSAFISQGNDLHQFVLVENNETSKLII